LFVFVEKVFPSPENLLQMRRVLDSGVEVVTILICEV